MLYYVARWYDGFVGRFVSPDSMVPEPGDPQSLDRFAYAGNSPLRYSDPTEHYTFEESPDDRRHLSDPQVRSTQWYTQPEWDPEPQSDAEIILTAASPVLVPVAAVAVEVVVADVAVPAAQAGSSQAILWLVALGNQLWDRVSGATNGAPAVSATEERTILWLEEQVKGVHHIMGPKHAWDRLVPLTGDPVQDYRAVQP